MHLKLFIYYATFSKKYLSDGARYEVVLVTQLLTAPAGRAGNRGRALHIPNMTLAVNSSDKFSNYTFPQNKNIS